MILAIDQSLSKCAIVAMRNGAIIEKRIIRTGSTSSKEYKDKPKADKHYYNCVHDQINHIVNEMLNSVVKHKPKTVVFETPPFGASGNAKNDLAYLFGGMVSALRIAEHTIKISCAFKEVGVSQLKTYARGFLPEDEQFERDSSGEFVRLKTKRKGGDDRKFIKMDKKLMVRAVEICHGSEIFKGLNYSNGKDDLADAILLGMYIEDKL